MLNKIKKIVQENGNVITIVNDETGINRLDDLILDGAIQRAVKERQSNRVKSFQNSWDTDIEIPPINLIEVLNYPTEKKLYVYDGVTRCKAAMAQIAEHRPCRLDAVIARSTKNWGSVGDKLHIAKLFEKANSGKKVNTLDLVAARSGANKHPIHRELLALYKDFEDLAKWPISFFYRLTVFFLTNEEAYGLRGPTLLNLIEKIIDKDGLDNRPATVSHIVNCLEEFLGFSEQMHYFSYLEGKGVFDFYPLKKEVNVKRDCRFYEGLFRFFWIARKEGADDRRIKKLVEGRCDLTEFYCNKHQYKITKSEERPNLIMKQLLSDYNFKLHNPLNPERFKVKKISSKKW